MNTYQTVQVVAHEPRRHEDPLNPGATSHIMRVSVESLPAFADMPLNPNPRRPDSKTKQGKFGRVTTHIHKGIVDSLLNRDLSDASQANTFHLKNKGITLIATKCEVDKNATEVAQRKGEIQPKEHIINIQFDPQSNDGLLDGAHTHALIDYCKPIIQELNAQEDSDDSVLPIRQYVTLEVMTGYPPTLIPEISKGRNTGLPVSAASIIDYQKDFDWIKDSLSNEAKNRISFYQGDETESKSKKPFDVVDLLAIMYMMDIDGFPASNPKKTPHEAYTGKGAILELYSDSAGAFRASCEKMSPILEDMLILYDTVNRDTAAYIYDNKLEAVDKSNYDNKKKREIHNQWSHARLLTGKRQFHFLNETGISIHRGAHYALFQTMRSEIVEANGKFQWKKDFNSVKHVWNKRKSHLVDMLCDTLSQQRHTPSVIGGSSSIWENLFLHSLIAQLG